MRLAYELSYSNTVLFARSPVRFQYVPRLTFPFLTSTRRLTFLSFVVRSLDEISFQSVPRVGLSLVLFLA